MSSFPEIAIVWFKRDFRWHDHAPLREARLSGYPLLLLALFEPGVQALPDFHIRHHRFVYGAALDMEAAFEGEPLFHFFHQDAWQAFEWLAGRYQIKGVYSHMEVGVRWTYERDIHLARRLRAWSIPWYEFTYNGIVRGARDRRGWSAQWHQWVEQPLIASTPPMEQIWKPEAETRQRFARYAQASGLSEQANSHQPGGRSYGLRYLNGFLQKRHREYLLGLAKPQAARKTCSRLSPYLSWGCLSHREVWQTSNPAHFPASSRKSLEQFRARMRWHDHLIQKFESEPGLEERNQNSAYDRLRTRWNEAHYQAWQKGQTGFPLVDASMRCVCATGYLNFRMRAMLVSFLTHLLWLDWRRGSRFLAAQFLDYEPGIHYPQFQMQAGTVGIHTPRVYNPVRQARQYDEAGIFIRKWVPELAPVPVRYLAAPWQMSYLEARSVGFYPGADYPYPVVHLQEAHRRARHQLWNTLQSSKARQRSRLILDRHVEDPEKRKKAIQQGQPT